MLLEYTPDTDESTLQNKAIELRRRVAGRKLNESIEAGIVNDDLLLELKEKNKSERNVQSKSQIELLEAEMKERVALTRTNQHLNAVSQVRHLARDVARAARLGKARLDSLNDLERRINIMRSQLHQPGSISVDTELNQELKINNKLVKLEKKFEECSICNRRILAALIDTHRKMCSKHQIGHKVENRASDSLNNEELTIVSAIDRTMITALSTFNPQPPRNFRVVSKGISYIQWEWVPPVIDGGLVITDYEIAFDSKLSRFDRSKGKFQKWEESYCFKTTNWVYKDAPVCHNGYKIVNLRGSGEYFNFRIRCCNIRGWSKWVDMETEKGRVILDDPVIPSAPLFVTCDKITSSCLHISWSPPYFDGGMPITHYEVNYTVVERHLTVTARDVRVEVPKKFSTEGPITSTVIRNLPDNTDVINIFICAKNEAYLLGNKGPCKQAICRTTPCSRYSQLYRELDLCLNSTEEFIDSSFFTGVKQRLHRIDHMKRVREELLITQPDPIELQEEKEWQALKEKELDKQREIEKGLKAMEELEEYNKKIKEDQMKEDAEDSDEDDLSNIKDEKTKQRLRQMKKLRNQKSIKLVGYGEGFTWQQRKLHFEKKIKRVEIQINQYQIEKSVIDQQRLQLTDLMRNKEKILLNYQLEKERLKNYHGSVITSSVLTGRDMQFKLEDYKVKLETSYQAVIQDIASYKFTVITNENRRTEVKQLIEQLIELKKERQARYFEFDLNYQKTVKFMNRFGQVQDESILKKKYFEMFVSFVQERISLKKRITDMFNRRIFRLFQSAWNKWCFGHFNIIRDTITGMVLSAPSPTSPGSIKDSFSPKKNSSPGKKPGTPSRFRPTATIDSVGDVLLDQAFKKRSELQDSVRNLISDTSTIQQKLNLTKLSRDNYKKLVTNQYFKTMEEGINHAYLLYEKNLKILYEGDLYFHENKYALAIQMYETQIIMIRSKKPIDIKGLSLCHGRLGHVFLQYDHQYQRAIVEFDRQLSLAREIMDKSEESDSFYGLGYGYYLIHDYYNSIYYLNIAQAMMLSLNRSQKYLQCLQIILQCYQKLQQDDKIKIYQERIKEMEDTVSKRVMDIHEKLDDLKSRLLHNAAEIELVIAIERTTYKALEMKNAIGDCDDQLKQFEKDLELQHDDMKKLEALIVAIKAEKDAAMKTDEPEMWSYLIHDQPQIIEIEELKQRLHQRLQVETSNMLLEKEKEKKILLKMKNLENSILEYDQILRLEEGALMKHSRLDKPFRCIGLCIANAIGNEVTGTATGGFEEFAAAESNNIHLIDYHTGALNHVLIGGNHETGHTGIITCLLHDGALIFSGASDETIICWQTTSRKLLYTLKGHEGSIVALAAENTYLISSASDATMRLWHKQTGKQLRVIFGHSKSVLSMEIGPTWLATGSADHEVRVWKIEKSGKATVNVESNVRLIGHEVPVTVVRYGTVEVLSGDTLGRIFIWWLKTGTVLRKCEVHKGPIKCLQFDSVHIVSGGQDKAVCITDIATGEVLQSLHGHDKAILSLAFDSERILSVGADNSVRYWQWGKQSGPQDKMHILEQNETMAMVAKQFKISVDNLMKWNGITGSKQAFPGMKLIVKKGDPNKLTHHEKVALERELRRSAGLSYAAKKLKQLGIGSDKQNPEDLKYNRIHQLATDIDFFSLGNRLFGREKRQMELFPDTSSDTVDRYSLASRLQMDPDDSINPKKTKVKPRYFIAQDSEDEWGPISDDLGNVMLDMMIELLAYEIVIDQKRSLRSKHSVLGRIFQHQQKLTKDLEESKAKEILDTVKEEGEDILEEQDGVEQRAKGDIHVMQISHGHPDPVSPTPPSKQKPRPKKHDKKKKKKRPKSSGSQGELSGESGAETDGGDVSNSEEEGIKLPPLVPQSSNKSIK